MTSKTVSVMVLPPSDFAGVLGVKSSEGACGAAEHPRVDSFKHCRTCVAVRGTEAEIVTTFDEVEKQDSVANAKREGRSVGGSTTSTPSLTLQYDFDKIQIFSLFSLFRYSGFHWKKE